MAETGGDEVPQAGTEALHAEPGEGITRQETADLLGNLFRTSKEEADNVERRHEKRVRKALEQENAGGVHPHQK
jgi:hypothetical protein